MNFYYFMTYVLGVNNFKCGKMFISSVFYHDMPFLAYLYKYKLTTVPSESQFWRVKDFKGF
jgi:hypothetical protein